jgi:flagellar secretion chaperone FliS
MFSPAFSTASGRPRQFASAYASIGIETAVYGASAHKLVELLFDGFMEAVAQARGAMRARQIEAKGKAIGRAARIIEEGLKAGLDRKAGGKLAERLALLYAYVAMRLTYANLKNDESALDECVRLIGPLREAWIAIGPQVDGGVQ